MHVLVELEHLGGLVTGYPIIAYSLPRTRFLLQSGVLQKPPLWLEVVEAFPPLLASQHNRKAEPGQPPSLSYPEETLRKLVCMSWV